MGSSSSKFKKYLQHGDEYAAMQVYQSSPDLRRDLDPNCRQAVRDQEKSSGIHFARSSCLALNKSDILIFLHEFLLS